MNCANPTPLRIGMTGQLAGRSFRVIGRVVLSMQEDGQTWYWNEYNLAGPSGETVTLSYEDTESGPAWRLFTLFEPEFLITAADAATKRVGDPINLEGTDLVVTLVSESRVRHIEGTAPEGVEMHDVARYFNAEQGNTMIVVSWTGDEVECYRGEEVSGASVSAAFGFAWRGSTVSRRDFDSANTGDSGTTGSKAAVIALAALLFIGWFLWKFPGSRQTQPFARIQAPALPGGFTREWNIQGVHYQLLGQSITEVAEVGRRFERWEFQLEDANHIPALLIYGFRPGSKEWALLIPQLLSEPFSPSDAATNRAGQQVQMGGQVFRIETLFQSRMRPAPDSGASPSAEDVLYGFTGKAGSSCYLVRWNQRGLNFYTGTIVPERSVERIPGAGSAAR